MLQLLFFFSVATRPVPPEMRLLIERKMSSKYQGFQRVARTNIVP